MQEAVRIMAALAIVPPHGHACTLEAITISGEFNQRERFAPIVQGLMDRSNDQLRVRGSKGVGTEDEGRVNTSS